MFKQGLYPANKPIYVSSTSISVCWTNVSGCIWYEWCCFYYSIGNSLEALLEALFAVSQSLAFNPMYLSAVETRHMCHEQMYPSQECLIHAVRSWCIRNECMLSRTNSNACPYPMSHTGWRRGIRWLKSDLNMYDFNVAVCCSVLQSARNPYSMSHTIFQSLRLCPWYVFFWA